MQTITDGRRLQKSVRNMLAHGLHGSIRVNRKELLGVVRKAQQALDLTSTERVVLAELAAAHQHEIQSEPIVFPSNTWLESRCGCTERNIRLVLSKLERKGLIARKDSANGKRYQRKMVDGTTEAFGISLSPLIVRRQEFDDLVALKKRVAHEQNDLRSKISVARRAIKEAIQWLAAIPEIDTSAIRREFDVLVSATPLRRGGAVIEGSLCEQWALLRTAAENMLVTANDGAISSKAETPENTDVETISSSENSAIDGKKFRRKENDSTYLSNEVCRKRFRGNTTDVGSSLISSDDLPPIFVVDACPAIRDYGSPILTPADLIAASDHFRGMLGASREAVDESYSSLGAYGCAAAICYTLQKCEDDVSSGTPGIDNPGAYLRTILRRCASGQMKLVDLVERMRRTRIH